MAARIGETVDDLMAEARSEMESEEAAEHEHAEAAPRPSGGLNQVNEAKPKEEPSHAANGKD